MIFPEERQPKNGGQQTWEIRLGAARGRDVAANLAAMKPRRSALPLRCRAPSAIAVGKAGSDVAHAHAGQAPSPSRGRRTHRFKDKAFQRCRSLAIRQTEGQQEPHFSLASMRVGWLQAGRNFSKL